MKESTSNPTHTKAKDDNEEEELNHAGSTEAGIVRGVSRSVAQRAVAARSAGRTLAKLPPVGKLPRAAAPKKLPVPKKLPSHLRTPRKVPVRKVARVTDRMSTGLDVLDAFEEDASTGTRRNQQRARIKTFAVSLVKNSVLGAFVFETYCWVVAQSVGSSKTVDEPMENEKDMFETATVPVHFVAGALGGSLQGIGGTLWETAAQSLQARKLALPSTWSPVLRTTSQHAAAHSILFGCYESCKRLLLPNLPLQHQLPSSEPTTNASLIDLRRPHQRVEYFLAIACAGGFAGQLQHVASHIFDQPSSWRNLNLKLKPPSLASTLWAFPPSAIAFLAFEYGKDQVTTEDDEDD